TSASRLTRVHLGTHPPTPKTMNTPGPPRPGVFPFRDTVSMAPADTLRTRTFVGLLIAQFLAAFNDQALHAASMFFAINRKTLTDAQAISLMPILFYAPWALFVTL